MHMHATASTQRAVGGPRGRFELWPRTLARPENSAAYRTPMSRRDAAFLR